MHARTSLLTYDPDKFSAPVVALHVAVQENEKEIPAHTHHKGQLIIALQGAVICNVPSGIWIAPPQCGLWVPGGVPHSNRLTINGRLCFLFIEPSIAEIQKECCTLSLSPLVLELILRLAELPPEASNHGQTHRLISVLLDELAEMKTEQLHLPISSDPRLRSIADALIQNPSDRSTAAEWAHRVAMSERTLARLVLKETGMTFGRWRQQLQIIMALRWLAMGVPVQHISGDLGYESTSAFITMFKKVLGYSPTRYIAAQKTGRSPLFK